MIRYMLMEAGEPEVSKTFLVWPLLKKKNRYLQIQDSKEEEERHENITSLTGS